jgi:hypothetical protein
LPDRIAEQDRAEVVSSVSTSLSNSLYIAYLEQTQTEIEADGKIILKWIFGKQGGRLWRELIWFRLGP